MTKDAKEELIAEIKERSQTMSWVDIDEMVLLITSRETAMLEEIEDEITPMLSLEHHYISEEMWRVKNILSIIQRRKGGE